MSTDFRKGHSNLLAHAVILLFVVVLGLLLSGRYSFAGSNVASGECGADGNNVSWSLDADGVMRISGFGYMEDYEWDEVPPWNENKVSITKVVVSRGVMGIGTAAFNSCINLTAVELPFGLTRIGNYAFSYCISLTEVDIPSTVNDISRNPFTQTPWLTSLGDFPIINGILIDYQGNDENLSVPAGVKQITGHFEVNNSDIKSLSLPEGVETLGDYTCFGCENLTSVSIPGSVTSIGYSSFTDCSEDLVISGYKGSAAEAYCNRKGLAFHEITEEDQPTPKPVPAITPSPSPAPAQAAPSDVTDLPSVRISKPKASKKSMLVRWKKLSRKSLKSIKKIEIQYSTDPNFSTAVQTKYTSAKKASVKLKGLQSKQKYYVRIRSYTSSGAIPHVSAWSSVRSVKVK